MQRLMQRWSTILPLFLIALLLAMQGIAAQHVAEHDLQQFAAVEPSDDETSAARCERCLAAKQLNNAVPFVPLSHVVSAYSSVVARGALSYLPVFPAPVYRPPPRAPPATSFTAYFV